MSTIKDIAEQYGVSKQAVSKWIEKAEEKYSSIPYVVRGQARNYGQESLSKILEFAPEFRTNGTALAVIPPSNQVDGVIDGVIDGELVLTPQPLQLGNNGGNEMSLARMDLEISALLDGLDANTQALNGAEDVAAMKRGMEKAKRHIQIEEAAYSKVIQQHQQRKADRQGLGQ